MSEEALRPMQVDRLIFDRDNPRLVEFEITSKTTDEEMIQLLWNTMDVHELVLSIAASGFFPHEALIVSQEAGTNIVIEGNRRLAAVRVLLEPEIVDSGYVTIPELSRKARESLQKLPVLIGTRQDSWRQFGFKHVNGPAKWGSYAKSRYIADVHRKYDVPLDDIARQIGDTHRTVQRLYRALMVLEQAEKLKVFDRNDRYRLHFLVFPSLHRGSTILRSANSLVCTRPMTRRPAPFRTTRETRWGSCFDGCMAARKNLSRRSLRDRIRTSASLPRFLGNREAVAALRDAIDLDLAFELSRPSSTVFEEVLLAAKRNLQKARGLLSTGYGGSQELLRITGTVTDLAYDLYEEMERKHKPRKRRRIAEHE